MERSSKNMLGDLYKYLQDIYKIAKCKLQSILRIQVNFTYDYRAYVYG